MKIHKIYPIALFAAMFFIASCSDQSTNPTPDQEEEKIEGNIYSTWTCSGENLPTDAMRDMYTKLELTFVDDDTYTWIFYRKSGDNMTFKGDQFLSQTEDKHTSGAPFYWVNINVKTIDGQPSQGGWEGIMAFEDPTTLKVNVEPSAHGWTKWPNSEDGLGSGQSGMSSVYTFTQ